MKENLDNNLNFTQTQVSVLGEMYKIDFSTANDDSKLSKCAGYCDDTIKRIVIDTLEYESEYESEFSKGNLLAYQKQIARHELIHAFLFESGLAENSWGNNEEMVDWIAKQFPKMVKAFETVRCM